jgi:hypothetical protein
MQDAGRLLCKDQPLDPVCGHVIWKLKALPHGAALNHCLLLCQAPFCCCCCCCCCCVPASPAWSLTCR